VCAFFLAIPVTPLQPPDYITGRPLLQGQVKFAPGIGEAAQAGCRNCCIGNRAASSLAAFAGDVHRMALSQRPYAPGCGLPWR
jgi:hypothetical protein